MKKLTERDRQALQVDDIEITGKTYLAIQASRLLRKFFDGRACNHKVPVSRISQEFSYLSPALLRDLIYSLRFANWSTQQEAALPSMEEVEAIATEEIAKNPAPAPPEPSKRVQKGWIMPEPGTVLKRVYKNEAYEVEVSNAGFKYNNQLYGSLSAAGKAITGKSCNGYVFFKIERS